MLQTVEQGNTTEILETVKLIHEAFFLSWIMKIKLFKKNPVTRNEKLVFCGLIR